MEKHFKFPSVSKLHVSSIFQDSGQLNIRCISGQNYLLDCRTKLARWVGVWDNWLYNRYYPSSLVSYYRIWSQRKVILFCDFFHIFFEIENFKISRFFHFLKFSDFQKIIFFSEILKISNFRFRKINIKKVFLIFFGFS